MADVMQQRTSSASLQLSGHLSDSQLHHKRPPLQDTETELVQPSHQIEVEAQFDSQAAEATTFHHDALAHTAEPRDAQTTDGAALHLTPESRNAARVPAPSAAADQAAHGAETDAPAARSPHEAVATTAAAGSSAKRPRDELQTGQAHKYKLPAARAGLSDPNIRSCLFPCCWSALKGDERSRVCKRCKDARCELHIW